MARAELLGDPARISAMVASPRLPHILGTCLLAMAPCLLGGGEQPPIPIRQAAGTPDFRAVIGRAKQRVFPAVVFIKCIQETHERGHKASQQVTGSGVLISATGELLTNWHVVDKALEVRCLLSDGRAFHARVVGTDKDIDLALLDLQIEAGQLPLPFAVLGDSGQLEEGDFVMAMGAPWGLNRSVSIGIVSCTRRYLPDDSQYSLWLQTDAAISPGNSGGPLVNTEGEVVGINSRGVLIGGDVGFALPSETVKQLLPRLRSNGMADWSWTGLQLQPLRDFERDIYFDAIRGVMVADTHPDSPAQRAGVRARDRIVQVNGEPVSALTAEDLPALRRKLGLLPKGAAMTLDLVRNGEELVVELVPRPKGDVEGEEIDCPRWDLTVKAINQFDNPELHFYRREGVFIYGIEHPGNAYNARLRKQDIILRIGDEEIATINDVRAAYMKAVDNVGMQPRIVFTVLRAGLMQQVILDFARDYEKE